LKSVSIGQVWRPDTDTAATPEAKPLGGS
jgi:hypothetical protein